ncbi:MAG TPA: cupin domain-containing protein, partial [Candidatus Limnocylindrales bacterium]|nr:cupin domain-containing protein [Candidatus Limnocylindrales bacterium]
MPIEVRRFGVGFRRPEGPPGTRGLEGQVIHSDARGVVAELAFARGSVIEPHTNPNTAYFIVIEGGGWVQVGEERIRVAAGEAVLWPPNVVHGAWTERSQVMRAFVVEFAEPDETLAPALVEGRALVAGPARPAAPGEGRLRPPERR